MFIEASRKDTNYISMYFVHSIVNPVAQVVTAIFNFSRNTFFDLYLGRSIRLKHVCERGNAPAFNATPLIVNFLILPSLPCNTLKPLDGTLLVAVTNCKSRALIS